MLIWLLITVGVVFLDQITKWLAVIFLQGNAAVPVIPWFIQLSYLENRGAAWGMFADQRWVFMTISTIAIIAICGYMFIKRPENKLLSISLAFIVGGGIGNMIDRVLLGFVVDFLEFTFIDFPIFNVADSFVCIGAGMLLLYMTILTVKEYKDEKLAKQIGAENTDGRQNSDARDGGNGDGNEN